MESSHEQCCPNNVCVICSTAFTEDNPEVTVTKKGLATLVKACKLREKTELEIYLKKKLDAEAGDCRVPVHTNCRKRFTDLRNIDPSTPAKRPKSRRSFEKFEWKEDCLFCSEQCAANASKHAEHRQICRVQTLELRQNILDIVCRREDLHAATVHHRVLNCSDLVSVEAIYHKKCLSQFIKTAETVPDTSKRPKGRPENPLVNQPFNDTCDWLENHEGPTSLRELQDYMASIVGSENTYSVYWLQQNLGKSKSDNKIFLQGFISGLQKAVY